QNRHSNPPDRQRIPDELTGFYVPKSAFGFLGIKTLVPPEVKTQQMGKSERHSGYLGLTPLLFITQCWAGDPPEVLEHSPAKETRKDDAVVGADVTFHKYDFLREREVQLSRRMA
ncbi:hypothetical protein BaRGS_00038875, partial [Batillaria attramentaria]